MQIILRKHLSRKSMKIRYYLFTTLIGISIFGLSLVPPTQAQPNTEVHLDVHRYCQRVFRSGGVWQTRQYVADGWHRYNSTTNTHECGFHYREIFGNGQVSEVETVYEEVWMNKACREQSGNSDAQARQEKGVVWCNQ